MSRVIGQRNSRRRPDLKLRRWFTKLALGAALGVPAVIAHPQTAFMARGQEPEPRAEFSSVVDGGQAPDLSSLDIPLLIRDSDRLGAAMHLRLPEYTYLQTRLSRELDQRGKLVEHVSVYEAYPIKVLGHHRHVISLISEDGAPISPKRLKRERQQAAKEIERAERDSALQAGGAPAASAEKYVTAGIGVNQVGDGVWIGVSQFLRNCRFGEPRYDRLADRDMIALNIHSCANDDGAPRERYLTGMSGVVWIDAADKIVARLEAWPKRATGQETPSAPPGAETIVYEQMRLPNGLWVPKRIRLNAIGKAELFNRTDKDMIFEFSHYQRFNIEVEELQQATPKPKP